MMGFFRARLFLSVLLVALFSASPVMAERAAIASGLGAGESKVQIEVDESQADVDGFQPLSPDEGDMDLNAPQTEVLMPDTTRFPH